MSYIKKEDSFFFFMKAGKCSTHKEMHKACIQELCLKKKSHQDVCKDVMSQTYSHRCQCKNTHTADVEVEILQHEKDNVFL